MTEPVDEKFLSRKVPSESEKKEFLASGKATTDLTIKENPILIPDKTPGREISIRPRSPFREIRSDGSSINKKTPSVDSSVRVDESDRGTAVRSVYEIGQKRHHYPDRNSPIHSSSGNLHMNKHHDSPVYGQSHYSADRHPHYTPPPPYAYGPPGHSGYPVYYGGVPPGAPVYYHPPPPPPPEPEIPDYDDMTDEEQKEARLIFKSKFATLKENYPDRKFDDYDPELPLKVIHRIYGDHLKHITIEDNSSITKVLLVIIFFCIEAFGTKVLGLNLQGYFKSQLASMKRYDRLLLELGEKYAGGSGNWPIEARLIFLAVINALIIVGVKFACDKLGYSDYEGLNKLVNGMIGGGVDSLVETKPPPKIDPITRTSDPEPSDTRNLMGGIQNLISMANQTLGNGNGDLTETIGNIGSSILAGGTKTDKKSKRGVRFGHRN